MIDILQYRTIVAAIVALIATVAPVFGLDQKVADYVKDGAAILALIFLRLGIVKAVAEVKAAQK